MILGVLLLLASAVCYGVGAVLQAHTARSTPDTGTVDVRLLVLLVGRLPFLAGLLLDLIGFGAQFAALRSLPVFVVQAGQASSLAVTALVAVPVLGARLTLRQWLAVGAVCVGLALLATSAAPEAAGEVGLKVRLLLLGSVLVLAVGGIFAGRLAGDRRSVVLGLIAGLGFGVVAVAARALHTLAVAELIRDPAAYALVAGGAIAFLFYATALQRGSVTSTTAAVILGETLLPAVVGIVALGDHTRSGFVPVAVVAFVLVLAGAFVLAPTSERS